MSHTCLCLPSCSWYSFTDPGGMEGWVDLGSGTTATYISCLHRAQKWNRFSWTCSVKFLTVLSMCDAVACVLWTIRTRLGLYCCGWRHVLAAATAVLCMYTSSHSWNCSSWSSKSYLCKGTVPSGSVVVVVVVVVVSKKSLYSAP